MYFNTNNIKFVFIMGIGDWGLGIGDWGVWGRTNSQTPIPKPQTPQALLK